MNSSILRASTSFAVHCRRCIRAKDYTFPVVDFARDVECKFVHGSGPGGMNVNASINKCVLKHTPTGIVVFSHDTRSAIKNEQIARTRLIGKLDDHLNGDNSFAAINARETRVMHDAKKAASAEKRRMKEEAKRQFDEYVQKLTKNENNG